MSLRSSLQTKERELTEATDKFLQEKVGLARAQGELAGFRARCETDQKHISSLQSKVCSIWRCDTLCMSARCAPFGDAVLCEHTLI